MMVNLERRIIETESKRQINNRVDYVVDVNSNMAKDLSTKTSPKEPTEESYKDSEDSKVTNKEIQTPSLRLSSTISIPLKYVCLGVLVIQTSANILTLRYSRTIKVPGKKQYLASTAVLLSEVLKLLISYFFLLKNNNYNIRTLSKSIRIQVTENWKDGIKLSIPALLYVVQNNLLFLALTMLDAAVYQVTYQLKILTTALFSVIVLNKKISYLKWFSLLVLMTGVCIVQWPSRSEEYKTSTSSTSGKVVGTVAVLLACLSSGFSGVYFEKIIKGTPLSMWMRNLQLAFFSVILATAGVFYEDFPAILDNGFFQGYTKMTIYVVVSQGFGGLVIGAVVKYADNILKGFATSLSIVVSSVLSYYILGDFVPTRFFLLGSSLVVLSTYLYSVPKR